MKEMKRVWAPALLALVCSAPLFAANVDTVEQRLARMERVLESQSLLQMMERIDTLQQEMQQLRGQLEEQQHQMAGIKERQRELYLDIDRRMSRLEREGPGAIPSAPANGAMGMATPPLTSAPLTAANGPATAATVANNSNPVAVAAADPQKLEQERAAYQQAFELLRELRYEQATAAFRDFLKQYPNGRYAHIAQYWLGEAAYARRDFVQAIKDYEALLQNHPQSAKRAEAMLKIGYSYQELKRGEESKRMMEQLIELYPESTEAGQARNQLKRLKQSGG
ncbi:MAG: tol-pal system protein YbgF [Gammaproteobacteria bacterium]|nr:tol-pal system protein YbgF [Gammaproteobacteria bacterium]